MNAPVIDMLAALRLALPEAAVRTHEERLLEAIGSARTAAEFAVAWCRWYFDEDGTP